MKKSKTQYQESIPIFYGDRKQMKEELEFLTFKKHRTCQKQSQPTKTVK